jgi:hypothetical protein
MKKWICYNLFDEHPDDVDTFGMIGGLVVLGIIWFFALSFCVFIPLLALLYGVK